MPRYDFRCDDCGHAFEVRRSFSASDKPAACPHDGAEATRLFSSPLDLLVYGREPLVSTGRVTIPPDALSCHDHGPLTASLHDEHAPAGEQRGSRWHANGYGGTKHDGHSHSHSHAPEHGHGHPH